MVSLPSWLRRMISPRPEGPAPTVPASPAVGAVGRTTPEQLGDLFDWCCQTAIRDMTRDIVPKGQWGNTMDIEPLPRDTKLYRRFAGRSAGFRYSLPAYLSWSEKDALVRLSLVDGRVQYNGSFAGVKFYPDLPLITDPKVIAAADDVFARWYRALGLPASRRHLPEPQGLAVPSDRAEALRAYLAGDLTLEDLARADHVLLWVDWGEDDEDIVTKCESLLKTRALSAEWIARDATADLAITFGGKTTLVTYLHGKADRDTTLAALQRVLVAAGYDLRFLRESRGSDTLAFVPLAQPDWAMLDALHPKAAAAKLDRLETVLPLFA